MAAEADMESVFVSYLYFFSSSHLLLAKKIFCKICANSRLGFLIDALYGKPISNTIQ